jgi:hypothetical protein
MNDEFRLKARTVNADVVSAIVKHAPDIEVLNKHGARSREWALELETFSAVLHGTGFIYPFDWMKAFRGKEQKVMNGGEIASATLYGLRRIFTYHIRAERFCEGHMAEITRTGTLAFMLARLQGLQRKTPKRRRL